MKKLLIILFCLAFAPWVRAQIDPEAKKKIESARIGLITERLGLTPEQAERFWPIYREFLTKRRDLNQNFKTSRSQIDLSTATEEQRQKLLERQLELKQKQLDLEKDYSQRLMRVIDSRQILALRRAEEEFRKRILEELQRRRAQNLQRDRLRDQSDERLRNRRNN